MMFPNENKYNDLISQAASDNSVSASIVKGIIAQESNFVPSAYRAEPSVGDASYGLMQILYTTAQGLGYTSGRPAYPPVIPLQGLFDPATNIAFGTIFFSDLVNTAANNGWGVDSAISAYNAGFSSDRTGDGKRSTSRQDGYVADGSRLAPFVNQSYVDAVMRYAAIYSGTAAAPSGGITPQNILLIGGVLAALAVAASVA
jgi:soluble lytic murein transglycosylase-like protein